MLTCVYVRTHIIYIYEFQKIFNIPIFHITQHQHIQFYNNNIYNNNNNNNNILFL